MRELGERLGILLDRCLRARRKRRDGRGGALPEGVGGALQERVDPALRQETPALGQRALGRQLRARWQRVRSALGLGLRRELVRLSAPICSRRHRALRPLKQTAAAGPEDGIIERRRHAPGRCRRLLRWLAPGQLSRVRALVSHADVS
jgi:hypothetical protein